MTIHLERRKNYYVPSSNEIEKLFEAEVSKSPVANIDLMHSGLANTNYIITLDNHKKYALKFHTRDIKTAEKEMYLAKLLTTNPLVPQFIYHDNSCENFNFPFSIITFHDGWLFSDLIKNKIALQDLADVYHAVGTFLKNLNQQHHFMMPGMLDNNLQLQPLLTRHQGYSDVTCFILDCLDHPNLITRLTPAVTAQLREAVKKNDYLLTEENTKSLLVHGDFKPENILVYKQQDKLCLSAVLDWEYAYSGSPYGDIGTLFREIHPEQAMFKESFAKGFNSDTMTLGNGWEKVARLTDLINICDFLIADMERPILFDKILNIILTTIHILNH